jgi:hypothetical protein
MQMEAAIKQALAAPVQEPVATLLQQSKENFERNFGSNGYADWIYKDLADLLDTTPAAQRQWVGLTQTEVDECYESVMFNPDIEPTRVLVYQAIEAKLKERNV